MRIVFPEQGDDRETKVPEGAAMCFSHPVANTRRGQTRFFDANAMKMRFPEVRKYCLLLRPAAPGPQKDLKSE